MKTFIRSVTLFLLVLAGSFAQSISLYDIEVLQEKSSILHCELQELSDMLSMSESFLQYESEYKLDLLSADVQGSSLELMFSELAQSQIILLGDNHTNPDSQTQSLELMSRLRSLRQPIQLVIEWIDVSYQRVVNQYLMGGLELSEVREKIDYQKLWGFDWDSYSRVLEYAKENSIPVHLVENLKKSQSLTVRDDLIEKKVLELIKAHSDQSVLVIYGTYHVLGENHLLERFLNHDLRTTAVISQAEDAYWSHLQTSLNLDHSSVLSLGENRYYWHASSPLEQLEKERQYYLFLMGMDEDETFCY